MDSESGDEPTFTDCQASGSESGGGALGNRKRQFSLHEMVQKAEGKRAKRKAVTRRSGSPPDPLSPAAKRTGTGPTAEPLQLNAATLAEIKRLIDVGSAEVIRSIESKLDGMERRLNILEGECMEKDREIQQLSTQLQQQVKVNEELEARLEEMDNNGRLSSLILTCDAFASHPRNADIEQLVVAVLNERVVGLNMSKSDLQAAHKLQSDAKVICKFVKRQVRDTVYDARFDLARLPSRDGRRPAPLYISESLTPRNRLLYEELLRAKRPENGGMIASVFSRRGGVWCRKERGGANLRVQDEENLRRILDGKRFLPQPRPPSRRPPTRTPPARRPPGPPAGAARDAPRAAAGREPPGPAGLRDGESGDPDGAAASPVVADSAAAVSASEVGRERASVDGSGGPAA